MRTLLLPTLPSLLLLFLTLPSPSHARRGALVREGMSSKSTYDNPLMGSMGDITIDPDVTAITSRTPTWTIDPLSPHALPSSLSKDHRACIAPTVCRLPLQVTFKSKTLAGGKRSDWMRTSAVFGTPLAHGKKATAVRAVWTMSAPGSANSDMTVEQGKKVLEDCYDDCIKRLYGRYVELEVLLPQTTRGAAGGGPPPSVVYRVPIAGGHVNKFGMVSKSRASVTLYPNGRTLSGKAAGAKGVKKDLAIPLGMTKVHLPMGPGLVDPGWARGKRLFWKGRSVGLL
mmetsp:Transcript_14315/g.30056  ORF Transcript_14315/g.30056 Transcript_14315/m.30056 type:complete len:285 (-) Transcript_14315:390-1244(-)|eukprot:CAMPEP_0171345684 /NCGR_PEP_ID=MMETSP0878-20121228/22261_1 /TAXON_ID=67004 /ORGANISM="Thalassiosira weissflogii, Strain CCMP1336" /LENGTH=284 /DNA_ID=CAMNT_0011849165 /DNA_START=58 /DNA_END=912 /DNA_ORIENTATION=-